MMGWRATARRPGTCAAECSASARFHVGRHYPVAVATPGESSVIDRLRLALPGLRTLTDPADVERYRWDATEYTHPGTPLAVVFPRSTAEVSTVVRMAAEQGVPIVPRGAGTGLSGGATAVDGAISVVLEGMNDIIEIDPANLLVVTQPGVINAELGRAVAEHGLFYPPDPASYETCSIGGNLAENAGGLRCVKYGVTGDYVLGLEVVLADGEVIRTGGRVVKDVMGYDLTHLFVGSEGTLGIITEATLRLRPAPPPKVTMLAFFPSVAHAGDAVSRMTAEGLVPVTLELMDQRTLHATDSALGLGLDRNAGAMLLIESDAGPAAAAELDIAEDACRAARATSVQRATDGARADILREARRKAYWALEQEGVARMEDVGVPRSRVAELLVAIESRASEHGVDVGIYGHAGDGNFHPTFVEAADEPAAEARIDAVRADIYRDVIALGGTVSGEHGTGTVKRGYLEAQRGARGVAAMRAIKDALDPQGILNPGKVFAGRP
jgi:glycolate oxidase